MIVARKKIRRRRGRDELFVQQTHDAAAIGAMLRQAGLADPVDFSMTAQCFLMAYLGDSPVGVVGLETEVDAALLHPLFVLETARRRGVGAALVRAARAAAHARGARTLYAAAGEDAGYFARFGFAEAEFAELATSLPASRFPHMRSAEVHQCLLVSLDISHDGLVER